MRGDSDADAQLRGWACVSGGGGPLTKSARSGRPRTIPGTWPRREGCAGRLAGALPFTHLGSRNSKRRACTTSGTSHPAHPPPPSCHCLPGARAGCASGFPYPFNPGWLPRGSGARRAGAPCAGALLAGPARLGRLRARGAPALGIPVRAGILAGELNPQPREIRRVGRPDGPPRDGWFAPSAGHPSPSSGGVRLADHILVSRTSRWPALAPLV